MSDESIFADLPREGETVEEVLNSVDKEVQAVEEEVKAETEVPAESQTEKEKLDLPDESILKKNSAWEEMRIAREEAEAKAQELEARLTALEKGDNNTEREVRKSEFVSSLVGDNEDVAEKWEKEKHSLKEQLKQELVQDQIDAQRKEQEQKEYWANWTQKKLGEVEAEFKVDFKADQSLKNELSKVMLDYSPTDEEGNLDYHKGMKIVTELRKVQVQEETQKTQVKKNIADATVSKETSVQTNKGFVTSNDIRGRDWRSFANN
jgi:hypothetical protein